jgi:excisionase family DNA binding protein
MMAHPDVGLPRVNRDVLISDTEVRKVPAIEAEPLMTPQEVADFLAMPVLTLQTWRAKRTGPRAYRVGRHVRYRREEVEAWLEQQAGSAAP